MRVPHWHSDGDEIGLVLDGKIRVTIWNGNDCEKQVFTAEKMGSWFIPKGTLHCLENVSSQKTQFLVCYDNPNTADRDFIDAWHAMPTEIICASTFLSFEEATTIKAQQLRNKLSKFEPTKHLAEKTNHFEEATKFYNEMIEQVDFQPSLSVFNSYLIVLDKSGNHEKTFEVLNTMNKYKIEGYPTIKLLKDGQIIEYDAKPTKDTIIQFLNSVL
jgi:hypothetical protein